MSRVQWSEWSFQVVYCREMHVSHACHMHEPGTDARIWTPWLVVPVIRSCQSPIWIWLENYLQFHLHLH